MNREVLTVQEDQPIGEVTELLIREHIHGVPVLNPAGQLAGVVTQQDLFFSNATRNHGGPDGALLVRDVMTSPAVWASEDTDIRSLCRMMHRLRIHRVPIVEAGKVTGIVSSLDVCHWVAGGETP